MNLAGHPGAREAAAGPAAAGRHGAGAPAPDMPHDLELGTDRLYPANPARVRWPVYPALRPWSLLGDAVAVSSRPAEELLAERFGASAVVLTDSGRSALVLAIRGLGIGPGDEVVLPSFVCPAVADAVLSAGASPVLVDVDEQPRLDPRALRAAAGPRTRAVILTHPFGLPEGDKLVRTARDLGLAVIDDACLGAFSRCGDRRVGTLGDAGVLSFGAYKPLPATAGGALLWFRSRHELDRWLGGLEVEPLSATTAALAAGLRRWRLERLLALRHRPERLLRGLGWMPSWVRDKVADFPPSQEQILARRMHPLGAHLLASRLRRWDAVAAATEANLRTLAGFLAGRLGSARLLWEPDGSVPAYATIVLQRPGLRYRVSEVLAARGLQTCWNPYPLHRVDTYRTYARACPVAETLWRRVLSIPFRPPLGRDDLRAIAGATIEAVAAAETA